MTVKKTAQRLRVGHSAGLLHIFYFIIIIIGFLGLLPRHMEPLKKQTNKKNVVGRRGQRSGLTLGALTKLCALSPS